MDKKRIQDIFSISTSSQFETLALEVFRFQYTNNSVYKTYCDLLKKTPFTIRAISDIPFLPIAFFKTHNVKASQKKAAIIFESSGTTSSNTSKHFVTDINLYQQSFRNGFSHFYGSVENYCILALLPSYLERGGSSLIYMVNDMIQNSKHPNSGFYLHNLEDLKETLVQLQSKKTKTLLIGVSFALLDLAEQFPTVLNNITIMETGGMKGRRKELIREELHAILKNAFGAASIHSEYGMTELLSQAYSKGNGLFESPPWMQIITRDTEDPLEIQSHGKTGGINVIDLANINSCSLLPPKIWAKHIRTGLLKCWGGLITPILEDAI